jgi:hypothetical protein
MPSDRWTDETLALVMSTLGESTGDEPAYWREEAEDVLTALADAGLLAEPGGETREEWSTEPSLHPRRWVASWPPAPEIATTDQADPEKAMRDYARGIRNGVKIVRRTVHYGPWREAQ